LAGKYEGDPVGYARDILKIPYIWDKMAEIADALFKPPYRVMVQSAHSVGKTWLAAWLTNYHFDTFDPSVVITTAPTDTHIKKVLWAEIRMQRLRAGLPDVFIGPAAAEMRTAPDHYAQGLVSSTGEAFQGRHPARMMAIFDEALGVDMEMWNVMKTMIKPQPGHAWLAIFNPTNQSSPPGIEQQTAGDSWKVFSLSALDHPNILAEVAGEVPPIPAAVSLPQVNDWIKSWSTPLDAKDAGAEDVEWPLGSGIWVRPGPEMEARVLGRWPSQSMYGIWSEALFDYAVCPVCRGKKNKPECKVRCPSPPPPLDAPPHIGVDVARGTDNSCDFAAIHVRWGDRSLLHESHHGRRLTWITGRAVELAREYTDLTNSLRRAADMEEMVYSQVPIKVDDESVGAGITDMLYEAEMFVIPIRSNHNAHAWDKYPEKRSELWFQSALRAAAGKMSLAKLDAITLKRLKSQLMAPQWWLNSKGQRVVERKEITKDKLGRSPDDADSLNMAYYEGGAWDAPAVLPRNNEDRPSAFGPELAELRLSEEHTRPKSKFLKMFGR